MQQTDQGERKEYGEEGGRQEGDPMPNWKLQQQSYHLSKAFRIARKYYSRCFMTSFKSHVLQQLLQQHTVVHRTHPQPFPHAVEREVDWPYRSLLLKPNKSEHELLQIQFVSMCAQKIQSVFKGYLERKRFRIASGRLRRFTGLLGAFVKGWKVRCVMRCLKVQEETRSLALKRAELQKELTSATSVGSRYGQRRLDYLRGSLQAETAHFQRRFSELYSAGAWVFEPRQPFPSFRRVQKWSERKSVSPLKENAFTQELQTEQFNPVEPPEPKKKRVREMRDNAKRGRNVQQPSETVDRKEEPGRVEGVKKEEGGGDGKWSQASTMANTGEDRPIQAKGAYSYAAQEETTGSQQPSFPAEGENPPEENEERKAQAKKAEKKKLQKRKMYDPRKAIEQQKRKKKQQMEIKEQPQSQPSIPAAVKQQQQRTTDPPKDLPVVESKSQKVLKLQKEQHSRSTVNLPRNKSKVEAKIDCWGNRKTVAKKHPPQEFIKAIVKPHTDPEPELEPEREEYRQELTVSERLAAKMNERRGKGKERLEYSEQREKARLQMEKNCEQSQRIKEAFQRKKQQQAREAQATKQMRAQALRQRAADEQKQKRKDLVYRSVEELTETYKNQYLTRFQNLYPKLSLLLAARTSEQHSRIPVLTPDSDYVERMMEENKLSQRFWHIVSKMENSYKNFIKG